jgi:hypothetical protein
MQFRLIAQVIIAAPSSGAAVHHYKNQRRMIHRLVDGESGGKFTSARCSTLAPVRGACRFCKKTFEVYICVHATKHCGMCSDDRTCPNRSQTEAYACRYMYFSVYNAVMIYDRSTQCPIKISRKNKQRRLVMQTKDASRLLVLANQFSKSNDCIFATHPLPRDVLNIILRKSFNVTLRVTNNPKK